MPVLCDASRPISGKEEIISGEYECLHEYTSLRAYDHDAARRYRKICVGDFHRAKRSHAEPSGSAVRPESV